MATDLMRYDLLVQDALRGVVRTVLADAARNGLQGDHHFFITFKTNAPGLRLSDRMRERYPDEMTIILQHQFWDLGVTDHGFEVGLSFSNKPERLLVPFAAITTFHDPSVQFGLKFDLSEGTVEAGPDEEAAATPPESKPVAAKRSLAAVTATPQEPVAASVPAVTQRAPAPKPTLATGGSNDAEAVPLPTKDKAKGKADADADVAKVVSIDAFRKKP